MKYHTKQIVRTCIAAAMATGLMSHASDYKSAHKLEAGDVISADVLNEQFAEIEEAQRTITADDLVGEWQGGAYGVDTSRNTPQPEWVYRPRDATVGWTNVVITITKEGQDHYQLTSNNPDPFDCNEAVSQTNRIGVIEGVLFGAATVPYSIDRISKDRIRLLSHNIYADVPKLLTLDRVSVEPDKPKLSSASVSKKNVTLEWLDKSDNETGFLILRKDKVTGEYGVVHTTAANEVSYVDTVPAAGMYWYRIKATNNGVDSNGSNVKKVIVHK